MNKKEIGFVLIMLVAVCTSSLAQDNWVESLPSGWIRDFPFDTHVPSSSDHPTAGAIYLLDEDIYYVADKIEVTVVIMKIFNRRGYKHAEVTTPYYGKDESVEVRGRTRTKDGSITELKEENIHEIAVAKEHKRKKFTLPGIEDDCLIHYEMVHRKARHSLSGIRYFQNEESTLLSRFNLVVPKDIRVIYFDSPPGILDTTRKTPVHSEKTALYTFAKRDLIARETEAFMPPLFQYSPSLAFSVTVPEENAELVATWENVSRWYSETIERHFDPTDQMKKLAKELIRDCTTTQEKVENVFYFVQSHFKVNFPSHSIFDQAETIFNRQVGSSAEVSGILYGLLKSVEIESNPVLVPNSEMVTEVPDVPMLDWFGHLLLKVDADGEELWLDPYYGTNCINCVSEQYQGVDGLLIQKSEGRLIETPSVDYSANMTSVETYVSLAEDGSFEGESRQVYSPPRSIRIKNLFRSQTIPERKDYMAKEIRQYCPGAMLDSCRFGDLYDYGEDFEIYCRFHSSHYVQKTDSMLYINPNILNRDMTAKDISESTRIFPIMFDQAKTDVNRVVINLPDSYEVAYLPDPVELETDFSEFRTEYQIRDNIIIYKRLLAIKKPLIPQSVYKEVKRFFNQIFEEDQKFIAIIKKG